MGAKKKCNKSINDTVPLKAGHGTEGKGRAQRMVGARTAGRHGRSPWKGEVRAMSLERRGACHAAGERVPAGGPARAKAQAGPSQCAPGTGEASVAALLLCFIFIYLFY